MDWIFFKPKDQVHFVGEVRRLYNVCMASTPRELSELHDFAVRSS